MSSEVVEKSGTLLWARFKGYPNTDKILGEKAQALANVLCHSSHRCVETIFPALKKFGKSVEIDDTQYWVIYLEWMCFIMHYTNLIALHMLGAQRGSSFSSSLNMEVRESLSHFYEGAEAATQFRAGFFNCLSVRQYEYCKYEKILPEAGEPLDNSLIWEFDKRITRLLGFAEDDVKVIISVHDRTMSQIEAIDLVGLLAA
jgi:hypothetical protein